LLAPRSGYRDYIGYAYPVSSIGYIGRRGITGCDDLADSMSHYKYSKYIDHADSMNYV
jgi:hypothetical protein